MKTCLGLDNCIPVDLVVSDTNFNEWAMNKQLVFLEEVHVSGANRLKMMAKLKSLITNVHINIAEKHKSMVTLLNTVIIMAFTNTKGAIYIDENNRRWCVLESILQHISQKAALGKNYFKELFWCLDFPELCIRFFKEYRIMDDFDPYGDAPK